MFWRFFVVTPGNAIWDAFMEDQKAREEARKIVIPFMQSIGAEHCFGTNGANYSFTFKAEADLAVWRMQTHHRSYRPHQKRKNAAAMRDAVKALPASPHYDEVFRVTGLPYNTPCVLEGNRYYKPRVRYYNTGGPSPKLLLQIPWKNVEQERLDKYRIDNVAGRHSSLEMDYLLWNALDAMKEIKEWEALKLLDQEAPEDAHHI